MKNKHQHIFFDIIVPIYNVAPYLAKCLDSIISQSYPHFRLILIDDGSKDDSKNIAQSYAKNDERISLISQPNKGVGIARNVGISHASGDYVLFVDSDDSIKQDYLEKIYRSIISSKMPDLLIRAGDKDTPKPGLDFKYVGTFPTCSCVVKKSLLDTYPDVRFPPIQPCEDGIFNHLLLCLSKTKSYCIGAKYYYFQRHDSSERSIKADKLFCDIPKWFEILSRYYDKYDLWESHRHFLLSFIYKEPFGRTTYIPFSKTQHKVLYNFMRDFIKQHRLTEREYKYPSKLFEWFVKSPDFATFWDKKASIKEPLSSKEILECIFSIKNSPKKRFKIIKILGIKIAFKRRKK